MRRKRPEANGDYYPFNVPHFKMKPVEGVRDAPSLEEALILGDRDADALRRDGRIVCRPKKAPEGLRKHALVRIQKSSGRPFVIEGVEYWLWATVAEPPRELDVVTERPLEVALERTGMRLPRPARRKRRP